MAVYNDIDRVKEAAENADLDVREDDTSLVSLSFKTPQEATHFVEAIKGDRNTDPYPDLSL